MKLLTFALALIAGFLTGCLSEEDSAAGDDVNSNSQTHWLMSCTADGDCSDGLSCLCGVCTVACDADDACDQLDGGQCAIVGDRAVSLLCGEAPSDNGLCLPGCAFDNDCPEDTQCIEGACIPDEVDIPDPQPEPEPEPEPEPDPEPITDESLCTGTDGDWDETACGHYNCGLPNACEAIIPGCDCGEGANFVEGEGCIADPECADNGEQQLCEDSEGRWVEETCGHYTCGVEPDINCLVPDPGCDCGDDANFVDGEGCVADRACVSDNPVEALCEESGGDWNEGACGHHVCGEHNPCRAVIPGCNCGEGQVFNEERGCIDSEYCPEREPALCEATDGRWDEGSCGHYVCGVQPPIDCLVPDPGCNCGPGQIFDTLFGCRDSELCIEDTEEAICEATGGAWDENACEHYTCGIPNDCDAVIPGCNCGRGRNFVDGEGCATDPVCISDDPNARLCQETNGRWDETACGHYYCGAPNLCEAIIPGCDCGEGANFVEGEGCVLDTECADTGEQQLCEETAGVWDENSCGHYTCGVQPPILCIVPDPGCDCGPNKVFDDERGCVTSDICDNSERFVCTRTGGQWDNGACGHTVCGEGNPCRALIPGCDCGEGQVFNPERGCFPSDYCPEREPALCEASGGEWDEAACGHYSCGLPNDCDAIIPGCDCGPGQIFDTLFGCRDSEGCQDPNQALCEESDGRWVEETCGHFVCGVEPDIDCFVAEPGCDCGEGRNFNDGRGCFDDRTCR